MVALWPGPCWGVGQLYKALLLSHWDPCPGKAGASHVEQRCVFRAALIKPSVLSLSSGPDLGRKEGACGDLSLAQPTIAS